MTLNLGLEVAQKKIGWVLGSQWRFEEAFEERRLRTAWVTPSCPELVQQQESIGRRKVSRLAERGKLCRPRILLADVV